jgi:hypothetical protein
VKNPHAPLQVGDLVTVCIKHPAFFEGSRVEIGDIGMIVSKTAEYFFFVHFPTGPEMVRLPFLKPAADTTK